eukprot:s1804_g2.t1
MGCKGYLDQGPPPLSPATIRRRQCLTKGHCRGLQTVELPSVCVARSKSTRACLVLKVSALNFWLHFGD